ncbi:hypothetical protein [Streptomyces sp. NPDC093097]|uniref:hypothetical protein n=1 Tax=Streptomyces sp. NPDC093097 TaxID=3366027 RepID=UPI00380EAB10
MAAGSVSQRPSSSGQKGPKRQAKHAGRGRKSTKATSDIASDGWNAALVTMGLVNAGKGILPLAYGGEPRRAKAKAKQHLPVEVVVHRVVSQLRLPRPVIRMSPREDLAQVVRVPTWMWVERKTWDAVTSSVAVDGMEVTATARPRKAVWSMGDGGSVVCHGPGTPYSVRFDPKASSPDCGYTYQRASVSAPGKAFRVSVQVVWDVEWKGAGRSGLVPGLEMSAQRQVVVDEVQAIVTR